MTTETAIAPHQITKLRRDVVRRTLSVLSKHSITPRMLRVVFHSDELSGFDSPSPDDHIKIFLPASATHEAAARDFTPRAWDLAAGTLTLDFALHDHGPATEWAQACRSGDTLQIGGPRGSTVVPDDFDWYLLIGDAAALPSFTRRAEFLRPGVPVHIIALVANEEERQPFPTSCQADWLFSTGSLKQDALNLQAALKSLTPPTGEGFIWIATEDSVAHTLYECAINDLNQPKEWIKAAGYWHA